MLYTTTDETFFEDMDGLSKCVVLFYQDDCKPCHALMEEMGSLTAPHMQYNLSDNTDEAIKNRVVHPSTLCLFTQGVIGEMHRTKKAFAKGWTLEQIEEWAND